MNVSSTATNDRIKRNRKKKVFMIRALEQLHLKKYLFTMRHRSSTCPDAAADSSAESLMVMFTTCNGLNVSGSRDCKSVGQASGDGKAISGRRDKGVVRIFRQHAKSRTGKLKWWLTKTKK